MEVNHKPKQKKKDVILSETTGFSSGLNFKISDRLLQKIIFNFQMSMIYNSNDLYICFCNKTQNLLLNNTIQVDPTKSNNNENVEIFQTNLIQIMSSYITTDMLINIIEERNCGEYCGFPLCNQNLNIKNKSLLNEKKRNSFCSRDCHCLYEKLNSGIDFNNQLLYKEYDKLYYLGHLCSFFTEKEYFKQVVSAIYEVMNPFEESVSLYKMIVKQLEKK